MPTLITQQSHVRSWLVFAVALAGLSLRCSSDRVSDAHDAGGAAGESTDAPAGSPSGTTCEPGATRECIGPGACRGGQACSSDGSSWGDCDCGADGPGGEAGAGGAPADGGASASGGKGGSANPGGSGGSGGGLPPSCTPVPQAGCDSRQKCARILDAHTQSVVFTCVTDGEKAQGEACSVAEDGSDDCAQGTFCNALGNVPRCEPLCDVNADTCATHCLELSIGNASSNEGSGYGVCLPTCDLLEQDCSDGDGCVFVESPYPVCASSGPSAPGEACSYYDDCEATSACVLVNPEKTAFMCTPYCEAMAPGSCEQAGDTCLSFPQIYGDLLPPELETRGLCYPCAPLEVECELLAAGGCEQESDCDPLLDSMGADYTCSLPAGQCVLAAPR